MEQQVRPFSRCWGIGLGRTGTTSLCEAFSILGYRNVLHNPPFEALQTADAGADNGVTIFYKYLDYIYPGSKFVLTVRNLDSWLDSMEYASSVFLMTSLDDHVQIMRRMLLYETIRFERRKFLDAYARHYDDVKRYFHRRPDDLIEMNIIAGDGWESLCSFLGVPIPPMPFPHSHRRAVDTPAA
jgi:hypothetical protein